MYKFLQYVLLCVSAYVSVCTVCEVVCDGVCSRERESACVSE